MIEKIFAFFRKGIQSRIFLVALVLAVLLVIVIVRLFDLQIIKGSDYYNDYLNTTIKEVSIPALRGNIYDRNGKLIAGNRLVYSITISDLNYYTKGNGDFNEMLLRLLAILDKFQLEPMQTVPVIVDEQDTYVFSGAESTIRRFIRDVYGTEKINNWAEDGVDAYSFSAEAVMSDLKKNFYNFSSKWPKGDTLSKQEALNLCHIRYALSATAFTRYISTVIVRDVSDTVEAAILESQASLQGVQIEQTFVREYHASECFSSILGYVASITTTEIEELNAAGGDYIAGDLVGKQGIEAAYESYLQGKKGKKRIYVNSVGMILHEEILEEPVQGNDVYLSIDYDMTVATYNVMEQQLAGVIMAHLYRGTDYDPQVAYDTSTYLIPIRDVYFQMINNNIISMKALSSDTATSVEAAMEAKRSARKKEVVAFLEEYLRSRSTLPYADMSVYHQAYVSYFYSYLADNGFLLKTAIDVETSAYRNWSNGAVSFPTFLVDALKSGWVDLSAVNEEIRYSSVDQCYDYLVNILAEAMQVDYGAFDKLIYSELIHEDEILGTEVALAMIAEGALQESENTRIQLENGDNDFAYEFFASKIAAMQITPAQIALDPCSAGLVLTDPNTGELLACVSYPGYDLNRITEAAYYRSLIQDLSSPLYSRATQSRLAPGSTFKMITAIAAMESGYVSPTEKLLCNGIFDKLDHPRCWIYRLQNGTHGEIDMAHAIAQSCNCFFYECGYRFSLNENNAYSPSTGVAVLKEYAEMFGFGTKTGIETEENVSVITTELPVTSAIGQGTHAFTTISLARYVTAIASSGDVYDFKFIDHILSPEGVNILSHTPELKNHLLFQSTTWDTIHRGMYMVVHEEGSRNGDFNGLRHEYAAKSGSAQENRSRSEHGWYVTYGPYDDIQWAMAVQVPNGYSAGNAALIAKGVYEFLEGDISLAEILENSARGSATYIPD